MTRAKKKRAGAASPAASLKPHGSFSCRGDGSTKGPILKQKRGPDRTGHSENAADREIEIRNAEALDSLAAFTSAARRHGFLPPGGTP